MSSSRSANRSLGGRASKVYKPAPPVTTPPPPKRLSLPGPIPQNHTEQNVRSCVSGRSASANNSTRPTASGPLMHHEHAIQSPSDSPASASPSVTSSGLALTKIQSAPPRLPLRRASVPDTSSIGTETSVGTDVVPPLPPRTYSSPTPALPPRNYRTSNTLIAGSNSTTTIPLEEPQPSVSSSAVKALPLRTGERNFPRTSSSSSTSSVDSAQSSGSIVSVASSVSTTPSVAGFASPPKGPLAPIGLTKSPYIAELVKTLGARQLSPTQRS